MKATTDAQKIAKERGDELLKIEAARLFLEKKADGLLLKYLHAVRTINALQ
jgi:hypothetical protein